MAVQNSKRSMMVLYVDPKDICSHMVNIVLAAKGVHPEIIRINPNEVPAQLFERNPYGTVPTFVDKDLVLYDAWVIAEYVDERLPHPPLMPVYPIARAKMRLMIYRIKKDWFSLIYQMQTATGQINKMAQKELFNSLVAVAPLFEEKAFFLSDEFSLLDCCLGAMFWRLEKLGLQIPPKAKAIKTYSTRLFERPDFKASIIEPEEIYEY